MPNDARVRALLGDLGRATLRGVRKCPKCGTYNGTRGSSCKNRACDVVFNNRGLADKQNKPIDACKLITGGSNQLYSVRVREKGPDFRGFVHVPQNLDSASSLDGSSDALSMLSSQAQCFVDNCQRSYDDKGGFPSLQLLPCNHVQAAVRCYAQAQPLHIKHEILQTMAFNQEIKQAIWLLQSDSESPLVQRVSKNMMVVRCKPSPKCPLGYVHLNIFSTKVKDRVEHKYCCACKALLDNMTGKVPGKNPNEKQCLHYYACVSAFASDAKLSEEFSMYVSLLLPQSISIKDAIEASKLLINQLPIEQIVAVVTKQTLDGSPQEVSFQVLSDNSLLGSSSLSLNEDVQISEVHSLDANLDDIQLKIGEQDESMSFPSLESQLLDRTMGLVDVGKKVDHIDVSATATFIVHDIASARTHPPDMQMIPSGKRKAARKLSSAPQKKLHSLPEPLDESMVYLPFLDWLASVTERVNETMHYECPGQPSPLIFHVPNIYFDCLRERISNGGKKKRIPTVTSIQKLSCPMPRPGSFIKYTWQITNIIHVKKIFDTPQVSLDITRSFVENKDGSFDHFISLSEEEKSLFPNNMPLIRPLELKTYLKVGLTAPEQKEPTPFTIDWIPDVFPRTRLGEMTLTFEFGHQRFHQHTNQGIDRTKRINSTPKIVCAKKKLM